MQIRKIDDPATGWRFDLKLDDGGNPLPGGLVLAYIEHQWHNFAREVRVVGIWLEVETVDPKGQVTDTTQRFFALDDTAFTAGSVQLVRPAAVTSGKVTLGQSTFQYLRASDECLQFGSYFTDGTNPVFYAVQAGYTSKPALLAAWPNCELSELKLTQTFLFSRYAMSPPHEPGGVLTAARMHPVTRYEWKANDKVDRTKPYQRVKSLRVDHRINYFIDGSYVSPFRPGVQKVQAGLFSDNDTAPVGWGMLTPFSGSATSRAVFRAVEKPVLYEITAPGLARGFPVFTGPDGREHPCWDNIHWWGERGAGNPLISAPGGLHAVHLHWRWGAATSLAPHGGLPVFKPGPSRFWSGGYTPLVDPACWIQSIDFAIAHHQPWQHDTPANNPARLQWDTRRTFSALRASPVDISGGGDLVLWMAITVHREVVVPTVVAPPDENRFHRPSQAATVLVKHYTKPTGRVFIHGMFFAHEAEITKFGVGTTDPQHFPTDEKAIRAKRQWLRTP